MKKRILGLRVGLVVLLCPSRYRQGLLTVLAAYVRHSGDEPLAEFIESCGRAYAMDNPEKLGLKFIHVEVTCECGTSSFARTGAAPWKPGNVCPELPPVRLPVNGDN